MTESFVPWPLRRAPLGALLIAVLAAAPGAADPPVFDGPTVLRGGTFVAGAGAAPVENAVIVIVDGRIVSAGADAQAPAGAREIDCTGRFIYPAFVDGFTRAGVGEWSNSAEIERRIEGRSDSISDGPFPSVGQANRLGIRARLDVDDLLTGDAAAFEKHRQGGFALALVAPPQGLIGGRASVLGLGDAPLRDSFVRRGVVQTASFRPPGDRQIPTRGNYPGTLLGAIAHLRQTFLDAQWFGKMTEYASRTRDTSLPRDADLEALQSVIGGKQRVFIEAQSADEIHRALDLAKEFGLKIVIVGGREAALAVQRLKATDTPVVYSPRFSAEANEYSLDASKLAKAADDKSLYGKGWADRSFWPERAYELAKSQREEELRTLQALENGQIRWCFTTRDVENPADILEAVHLLTEAGLDKEAALRGLTTNAAALIDAGEALATAGPGGRADLTVLTAALGEKDVKVAATVCAGRVFEFDVAARGAGGEGEGRRGGRARGGRGRPGREPASPEAPGEEEKEEKAESEENKSEESAESQPASAPTSQPDDPFIDLRAHKPVWDLETDDERKPSFQTGGSVLLRNAHVITVSGQDIEGGSVLVQDGRIKAVGKDVAAPPGVREINLNGYCVMPGIFDPHAHIALAGVNEFSMSVTPEVRCRDVIESDDAAIYRAVAGGTTIIHAMHGSANTIGGQNIILKMKYGQPAAALIVEEAPRTVKFALGENVKRSGSSTPRPGREPAPARFPGTRMGVEATMRRALLAGQEYAARRAAAGPNAAPFRRDLRLEALADILAGDIRVNCHCYRADEILRLLAVAEDFGVRVAALHHVLEGYRIMPEIARHGCGTATFADWWAYKIEAYDAVPHNAGMLLRYGINSTLKSDSGDLMRHMNHEAAKAMKYGGLDANEALRLITLNPARMFGLDARVGSIEVGKDGDLAVFDGHPLDSFARCVLTLIDGEVYFAHRDFDPQKPAAPARPIKTFERATPTPAVAQPERAAAGGPQGDTYIILNATVHPVSSPMLLDAGVLIRDGKVAGVGKDLLVPADAKRIDGRGLHVYPGLINAGTSVGLEEIGSISETNDTSEPGTYQPDLTAVSALNPHSAMVPVTRAEGITTALVLGTGPSIFGQAGLVKMSGWTMDEMLIDAHAALVITLPSESPKGVRKQEEGEEGGRGRGGRFGRGGGGDDGGAAELKQLQRFFEDARRYLAAREVAEKNRTRFDRDLRFDAMAPYVSGEKPVLIRASSYKTVLEAVMFADAVKIKPVILGGREAWRAADVLAARNVPVIYEGVYSTPSRVSGLRNTSEMWDANYRALSILAEAGVKFALAHREADLSKLLPLDAGFAVSHGLSPEAALRALTLDAAEILGIADRVGSLEPGKVANLVVATDHPGQATNQIRWVFIDGKPTSLETKHTKAAAEFAGRPAPALPDTRSDLKGPPSQTAAPSRR